MNEIISSPSELPERQHTRNRRLFNRYLVILSAIFLVAGSFWLGYSQGISRSQGDIADKLLPITQTYVENKSAPAGEESVDFSLFWKVWEILKEKHIQKDSLDAQKMVYGAIQGMVKATGDPYSAFFDPKETKDFSQDMEGGFEGIGAELGMKDDILTVIAPLENSPAQRAGIRPGDKIIKIGDKITSDITIDEAVDLIRGKKGTEIKLMIMSGGEEKPKEVSLTRDFIEVKSVKFEMKEGNIAYIRINKFSKDTAKEFNQAAMDTLAKNAKGIVIDVRSNPGGFLDQAVDVASVMIPKGKIVVTEEDSAGKKENLYTEGGDRLSALPAVMLINEGSASASEILAGALRDDREVSLIGKKSFGKGSVQELVSLPNKSSVKVTVARWLTPRGDYIMEKGITPDIEADLTLDDFKNNKDPQLDKAMEALKEKIK